MKKTVFVGISGGVDSSVSAALLKQATPNNFSKLFGRPTPKGFSGYNVVGVFIKTWHPDFIECNEADERLDAIRVCAHLNIPFLSFDFESEYKKSVADYMISQYRAGRTPNPDVMCNKEIKFGVFLNKALSMGADYVATGHYARVAQISEKGPTLKMPQGRSLGRNLCKGIDPSKDQSYFLWTLNQNQLSRILFPIGHLKKTQVRKLAEKFGLSVAEKKDSQGVCFLGDIDLKDFLKHYIKSKKGIVIDEKGQTIGEHDGALFLTLGERHGFVVNKKSPNDGPYYVVAKDVKKNIITVSQVGKRTDLKDAPRSVLGETVFVLGNVNWIPEAPRENKKYTAQIRYHSEFLPCRIFYKGPTFVEGVFEKSVLVASGQSIVIYDGDTVLGGGVVK